MIRQPNIGIGQYQRIVPGNQPGQAPMVRVRQGPGGQSYVVMRQGQQGLFVQQPHQRGAQVVIARPSGQVRHGTIQPGGHQPIRVINQTVPVHIRPHGPVRIFTPHSGGPPRQGVIQQTYPQQQQRYPVQPGVRPMPPNGDPQWRPPPAGHVMQNRMVRPQYPPQHQPAPQQQQPPQPQGQHPPGQPQENAQQHPPQQVAAVGQAQQKKDNIAYGVEHVFMENGKEVRKMPIDIDGQTIWVECVGAQKEAANGDIMMDLHDDVGIEGPSNVAGNKVAATPKSHTYSVEQKREIVAQVCDEHFSPSDVARKFSVSPHTIRDWVKKSGKVLPKTYKKANVSTVAAANQQTASADGQQAGAAGKEAADPAASQSGTSAAANAAAANSNNPLAPRRVPGKLALCKFCGNMSEDHNTCSRCKRRLPEDAKVVDDPAFKPKPDSTTIVSTDKQREGKGGSGSSLRSLRMPNKKRGGNPDEPVCIALSSDEGEGEEEEEGEIRDEGAEEIDLEQLGDKSLFEDVTANCPPNLCCSLPCRSIRVGNYKITPLDKITLSPNGIQTKVPAIYSKDETVMLTILKSDLVRIQCHFSKQMPLLFIQVKDSACARFRKQLKMTSPHSYYLDSGSKEETQKRITILPEKLSEENKVVIKQNFTDLIQELESKDANDILVRSSPQENNFRNKMLQGTSGALGDKKSSDTSVTKYCQFPPEGAGNVSVTNEDYACLEVEQFLNDVIIDFYLKYLQFGMFENEAQVRDKTHIFTTYFYKRLTTRPTNKNKSAHHPVEDDPNLTPAEKRYDRVRKWTKKVNLFEKDFIVVPINEHAHWFVCVICFPGQMGCVKADDGTPCDTPASQVSRVANKKNKKKKKPITIGSTTIIPLKGRDDIHLNFDDDSDRDEAEASEDDMEDELETDPGGDNTCEKEKKKDAEESSPPESQPEQSTEPTVQEVTEVKEEEPPKLTPVGVRQPCILIFDSLAGGNKARTCQTLRDYLSCEWKERMSEHDSRLFNKLNMPGCSPKVQQQPNFSDCGIYLLQYVESFFKSPICDYTLPITSLRSWFPEDEVRNKRSKIASLIRSLATQQNPDKEFRYPEIMFDGDDSGSDTGSVADHQDMEEGELNTAAGAGGDPTPKQQTPDPSADTGGVTPENAEQQQTSGAPTAAATTTTMVRITGTTFVSTTATNSTTIIEPNKFTLVRKNGNNQVRVTPGGTSLPAGVTVTPSSSNGVTPAPTVVPNTNIKITAAPPPGVTGPVLPITTSGVQVGGTPLKIITMPGNIQLQNRKLTIVSTQQQQQQPGIVHLQHPAHSGASPVQIQQQPQQQIVHHQQQTTTFTVQQHQQPQQHYQQQQQHHHQTIVPGNVQVSAPYQQHHGHHPAPPPPQYQQQYQHQQQPTHHMMQQQNSHYHQQTQLQQQQPPQPIMRQSGGVVQSSPDSTCQESADHDAAAPPADLECEVKAMPVQPHSSNSMNNRAGGVTITSAHGPSSTLGDTNNSINTVGVSRLTAPPQPDSSLVGRDPGDEMKRPAPETGDINNPSKRLKSEDSSAPPSLEQHNSS